jgi:hypothetical protein
MQKSFLTASALLLCMPMSAACSDRSQPAPQPQETGYQRAADTANDSKPSPAPAKASAATAISDPFLRADQSFSPHRLNARFDPARARMALTDERCAELDGFCEWKGADQVVHVPGGKLLAIKLVSAADFPGRAIASLGIGQARNRGDVISNVRAFLPEIDITCLEPEQAGEGPGVASCGGSFDNGGWIKLLFDSEDQLVSARIDAFQIN